MTRITMKQIIAGPMLISASVAAGAEPVPWTFSDQSLKNGLRVLVVEDHRSPLVSVQVWYHVGSKDENPERQGFAHMFEHMMFRGTDRIGPQDHFKYLQRYGSEINGYTSFDQTVYWETVPASQLDLALWLEGQRLGHLKINEEYFAAEREVVKEERRMRYLNRPYGKLYETLYRSAFQKHPYRWTPIGNLAHLNAATADELRTFFNTYYVPNNATLVVVGDVRADDVMEKAEKYLGGIPRRPEPPRVTIQEPPLSTPRRVEITDIAPSPMVVLANPVPGAAAPEAIPLDILARILSRGQSSRFYRHLVKEQKLAISASADDDLMEQAGLFTLSATLRPGVEPEKAEQALLEEIQLLVEKGIEPQELEKAKNQAVAEYVRAGETVRGKGSQLGYAAVILGDPHRVVTDLLRKQKVTADEVVAAAKRILRPDGRVTLIVRPDPNPPPPEEAEDKGRQGEQLTELPEPADLPRGQAPRPVDLPAPARTTLKNGLGVLVLTDHSLPAFNVSLNLLTGAKCDPDGQTGLASVTTSTLRRGTQHHTGDELAQLIDLHAMSLSEQVDQEDTRINMWALSQDTELAAQVLAEVTRTPTFPDAEVSEYVARAAARQKIAERDPSTVATRTYNRELYGANYLGREVNGTSRSLPGITPEAVRAFYRRNFAPGIATLIFSGDITPARAFELAEKYFGDWNATAGAAPAYPPPPQTMARVVLVDKPGAVQSEIRIGQIVPVRRTDPDYPVVRLISQIFGEQFGARLNRVLRIEKGLTYGARGYFDVDTGAAAMFMTTFTRTEKTAEAVVSSLEELEKLTTAPVKPEELELARDSLIGRFQMSLETPAQIAARYWDLIVWQLPNGWYSDYLRAVDQVRDVNRTVDTARRVLDPKRNLVVVVGNAAKVRDDLARIAPVTTAPAE